MKQDLQKQQKIIPYNISEIDLINQVNKHFWDDIDLIQQQQSQLYYTIIPPQKYRIYYSRLRKIIQIQQISLRTFYLTGLMLWIKTSNYYALMIRKKYINNIQNNNQQIENQLHFINCLLEKNCKQYHLWSYKKQLINISLNYKKILFQTQILFINHLLQEDSKNYHAWDYRFWLTTQCNQSQQELNWANSLIFIPIENTNKQNEQQFIENWSKCYSLWSYRHNLIKYRKKNLLLSNNTLNLQQDLNIVLDFLDKNLDNECVWNYLMGLCYQISENLRKQVKDRLKNYSKLQDEQTQADLKKWQRFALTLLLCIAQIQDNIEDQKMLIGFLQMIDNTRDNYYQYILQKIQ